MLRRSALREIMAITNRESMSTQHSPSSRRLENIEEKHRLAPRTYSIPRSAERMSLRGGDLVKLVFLLDRPAQDGTTGERMWVSIQKVDNGGYAGTLDNNPKYLTDMKVGDQVAFGPEHVAAIWVDKKDPR